MTKKVIDPNEEVVDMKPGDNGTYYPVAVVKVKDQSVAHNDAQMDMPKWFPAAYEMVNGFVVGLGAIENFMYNMKRMNRKVKRNVSMDRSE